ncbi:MAG TPA: M1 family metallopeptidase [Acidobacteriaceae bacterium]|nr:M1 family metallopeptidase [Acidobacteriaceae bacterium]
MRRAWLAVGLVCVLSQAALQAAAQRLPGGVRPMHYALKITPDLAKARFEGAERIDVVLERPSDAITLNAAEIEFESAKAVAGSDETADTSAALRNDKETQDATVTLDAAKEQATLHFAKPLPAGPVSLEIAYRGILNDKLRGFYLSKTKLRNYGVTQFEATDARRAFPSFDEPALKATFDVMLVVDAGDTAISNMQAVSDAPGPVAGKHTIAFATTPKMSTYLVAWLVGDFRCSEGKSDGVPIRVCATPDKADLTKFALKAAKWDLHYYDGYFGIHYPLKKLDLVAVPDFEAGAMENFGCITFRETELLADEKNGTMGARKEVATTVAHEIAHQWFGDLVTPEWWDNLWLNEGFATWMETKAAEKWQPKWEYAQDAAAERSGILDEDAARTTRPIREHAETPSEINELFDDIAYGKAGAVIAMVEHWEGEEAFRKGVQAYLTAHLYGNATAEDFWDAQARVSGLPVDAVMRSFIEQPGVPEVRFGPRQGTQVMAGQQRFIDRENASGKAATRRVDDGAGSAEQWTIPVCIKGDGCRLIGPGTKTIEDGTKLSFFYGNADGAGYYRSAYSKDEYAGIVTNAEKGLTPAERIGLLGDRWALMRSGEGTVGQFLDLALAVKNDQDPTVMESVLGRIGAVSTRIAADEDRAPLEAIVRREFGPVYAAMGGPRRHESDDHAELREALFEALGDAHDTEVLGEAQRLTDQVFSGEKPSDPNIVDAAVALTAEKGDAAMYDRLLHVVRETKDPDFRATALRALTWFEAPQLVDRTLQYAVSDEMRNQDGWSLIALLLSRRETQEQAWTFVKHHWDEIERRSTESSGARIIEAAGSFCSVEKHDDVAGFFAAHPVDSAQRTLAKSLDRINECMQLRRSQGPDLQRWLAEHGTVRPNDMAIKAAKDLPQGY